MATTSKGIAISIDAVIASLILLAILFVAAAQFERHAEEQAKEIGNAELEFAAAMISESLVKNRNEEQPTLGAAFYDSRKKRVEQNIIDETLLKRAGKMAIGNVSVQGTYFRNIYGESHYPAGQHGENCRTIERFVTIRGESVRKAVLGVVVCAAR